MADAMKIAATKSEDIRGIVLVKDPLVTEAYKNLNLKKGRASTIQVSRSLEARYEGYQKGKSFQAPTGSIEGKM